MKIELTDKKLEITIEDIQEIHDVCRWANLDEGELTTRWLELEGKGEELTKTSMDEAPCVFHPQIVVSISRNGDKPLVEEDFNCEYI